VPDETLQTGLSENATCGLAYLTFIPAIIFLVTAPYNQSAKVRFHCWQSIFLSIAWAVIWAALIVVGMIPVLNLLDVILMPVVMIGFLILWIILLVNALNGKVFKLPFISDLAHKQSGGMIV
jgi:uncharacterized membrane protein